MEEPTSYHVGLWSVCLPSTTTIWVKSHWILLFLLSKNCLKRTKINETMTGNSPFYNSLHHITCISWYQTCKVQWSRSGGYIIESHRCSSTLMMFEHNWWYQQFLLRSLFECQGNIFINPDQPKLANYHFVLVIVQLKASLFN